MWKLICQDAQLWILTLLINMFHSQEWNKQSIFILKPALLGSFSASCCERVSFCLHTSSKSENCGPIPVNEQARVEQACKWLGVMVHNVCLMGFVLIFSPVTLPVAACVHICTACSSLRGEGKVKIERQWSIWWHKTGKWINRSLLLRCKKENGWGIATCQHGEAYTPAPPSEAQIQLPPGTRPWQPSRPATGLPRWASVTSRGTQIHGLPWEWNRFGLKLVFWHSCEPAAAAHVHRPEELGPEGFF